MMYKCHGAINQVIQILSSAVIIIFIIFLINFVIANSFHCHHCLPHHNYHHHQLDVAVLSSPSVGIRCLHLPLHYHHHRFSRLVTVAVAVVVVVCACMHAGVRACIQMCA